MKSIFSIFFYFKLFSQMCVAPGLLCVPFHKNGALRKKLSIFFWIERNLLNIKSFFAPQITQDVVIITKNEFLRSSNSNYYICYYMEKNGSHWWGGMIFFFTIYVHINTHVQIIAPMIAFLCVHCACTNVVNKTFL